MTLYPRSIGHLLHATAFWLLDRIDQGILAEAARALSWPDEEDDA